MKRTLALIAGEPKSISSEIIYKTWKLRSKYKLIPFFVIGNKKLLESQFKKIHCKLKIKQIDKNFSLTDLNTQKLPLIDIKLIQKKNQSEEANKIYVKKYIFNCFKLALKLTKEKKIIGFVNCPVTKEKLFKKNYKGVTEYIAKKTNSEGKEVMLIFNKKLAVSPITTHIPIKKVANSINKKIIVDKILTINKFYKKYLKKEPKIGLLGLNPHNYNGVSLKDSEEHKIIIPAIKKCKSKAVKIYGPISPDTSFLLGKKIPLDVIVGMYHDQVIGPFKTIYKFDAINITLGLPFFRTSPDHGSGLDIIYKNKANPISLVKAIEFFNLIKKK